MDFPYGAGHFTDGPANRVSLIYKNILFFKTIHLKENFYKKKM